MSQREPFLWLEYVVPEGGYVETFLEYEQLVVRVFGWTEPPPPPVPTDKLNGRLVSGDIEYDIDKGCWVLENAKLEPWPNP